MGGFFGRGAENIFWAIVGALIYDNVIKHEPQTVVNVNKNEVIIQKNGDRIIVPREVYEQLPKVRSYLEVQKNLSKTFEVIEGYLSNREFWKPYRSTRRRRATHSDSSEVTSLDLQLIPDTLVDMPTERRRERKERVRLVVLKAWLVRSGRKWSFEWNGVPLSASITDETFFDPLESHEIMFGQGDALDVELTYEQEFDESLGVFVNDQRTFKVTKVYRPLPRAKQGSLPLKSN